MNISLNYFKKAVLVFIVELLIAQTSGFIRHTLGDFLVVILLFYLMKAFSNFSNITIGIGVLLFSFLVEFLQLTFFLEYIGMQNNKLATIIFGATFSIGDLIAYTLGIATVLYLEKTKKLEGSNLS
ncbi:Protein of unknown function [Tenacibaculum sp. MAR_2010_89]|uniref:ribosomal maturation YjgA family protein n=1 Tax=Tenacibaculum sp. MAR_2010_89 TaxID=1250198 RepID=UPI000898AFCC|nr:DUF2809 domain-containing protein [Tenacibaculum sp. MAR_2010_89]SED60680.1 Protein of unknown function [Tenacibaculum sp. MAR_2010_89]